MAVLCGVRGALEGKNGIYVFTAFTIFTTFTTFTAYPW